jgi:hypothetical protein
MKDHSITMMNALSAQRDEYPSPSFLRIKDQIKDMICGTKLQMESMDEESKIKLWEEFSTEHPHLDWRLLIWPVNVLEKMK